LQWHLFSSLMMCLLARGWNNLSITWDQPIANHNHPVNSRWTKSSLTPTIFFSCTRSRFTCICHKGEEDYCIFRFMPIYQIYQLIHIFPFHWCWAKKQSKFLCLCVGILCFFAVLQCPCVCTCVCGGGGAQRVSTFSYSTDIHRWKAKDVWLHE